MGVCCSNRRRHKPLQATLNEEVESDSDKEDENKTTTSPIDDDNTVILEMENDLITPSQASTNSTTPNGYTLTPSNSSINCEISHLRRCIMSMFVLD